MSTTEVPATSPAPATDSSPSESPKPAVPAEQAEQTEPVSPIAPAAPATPAVVASPHSTLLAALPLLIKEASYDEMWGVVLRPSPDDIPTSIVLEKFLRANAQDVPKAQAQLAQALAWRRDLQPAALLADTEFDPAKFADLGFVTTYTSADLKKEIVTWNIYGAVKDNKATFGDVQAFLKWRCALMELSIKELNLASATERIPEGGTDPYRMIQVHDYLNVSFLRPDPHVRAASKEIIQTMSMAYPELLKGKFFVNVPLIMGWFFTAMKLFISPETVRKFHPLSYGSSLAGELPDIGALLPKTYGGKGEDLEKIGVTVKYAGTSVAVTE